MSERQKRNLKKTYSVDKGGNGNIELSIQHPSNKFQMPIDAARSLAMKILKTTGGDQ